MRVHTIHQDLGDICPHTDGEFRVHLLMSYPIITSVSTLCPARKWSHLLPLLASSVLFLGHRLSFRNGTVFLHVTSPSLGAQATAVEVSACWHSPVEAGLLSESHSLLNVNCASVLSPCRCVCRDWPGSGFKEPLWSSTVIPLPPLQLTVCRACCSRQQRRASGDHPQSLTFPSMTQIHVHKTHNTNNIFRTQV